MPRVEVNLEERGYTIHIDHGLLPKLGALIREVLPKADRALIITDTNVAGRYGAMVKASLEVAGLATMQAKVPAGESSKSLAQAYNLYSACINARLERSSVIVAVGGGVVGDLAGFVAATYLRGIPYVQVPTTLLAQVDSSVGGKTGVDLPQGKNLVGAFHQPALVVADIDALTTLPRRELVAGLAEVVKHAVIRDAGFLRFLEGNLDAILRLEPAMMRLVVETNCRIKAGVVAEDEKESGLRGILNFGHTVGHAVEASTGYSWLHGECVAVGMMAAVNIARQAGLLQDPELPHRLERLLVRIGLPVKLPPELGYDKLAPLMQVDKKVEGGRVRWVLPVRAGEVLISRDVLPEAVRWGVESVRR